MRTFDFNQFKDGEEQLCSDYIQNITTALETVVNRMADLYQYDGIVLTNAANNLSAALQNGLEIDFNNLEKTAAAVMAELDRSVIDRSAVIPKESSESLLHDYEPLIEKTVSLLPSDTNEKRSFLEKLKRDFDNQPLAILIMLLTLVIALVSSASSSNTEINININLAPENSVILQSVQNEIEQSISEIIQNLNESEATNVQND